MKRAIAIEEASHCIIAERLGVPVRAVTIVPSGRHAGIVHLDKLQLPPDASGLRRLRLQWRAEGIVMLAGSVGRAVYTREPVCELLRSTGASDLANARRSATAYALSLPQWTADTRREVFAEWLDSAERLVGTNWHVITVLAERLSLNVTLAACDIARVIAIADRQVA